MAKAKLAFHKFNPETARVESYSPGDKVPDVVARTVGAHVLTGSVGDDGDDGDQETPFDGEAFDAAVEAKAAELSQEAADKAVADYREREQAAYDAVTSAETEFDPSADGVKAEDVKAYLEGLDRDTVAGSAEYDRVVQAETEGANRKSAIPASE
jgi:hypothetical protein